MSALEENHVNMAKEEKFKVECSEELKDLTYKADSELETKLEAEAKYQLEELASIILVELNEDSKHFSDNFIYRLPFFEIDDIPVDAKLNITKSRKSIIFYIDSNIIYNFSAIIIIICIYVIIINIIKLFFSSYYNIYCILFICCKL